MIRLRKFRAERAADPAAQEGQRWPGAVWDARQVRGARAHSRVAETENALAEGAFYSHIKTAFTLQPVCRPCARPNTDVSQPDVKLLRFVSNSVVPGGASACCACPPRADSFMRCSR